MGINEEFLNWCEGKWENEFKAQRLFSKLSSEDIDFLKDQYKADLVAMLTELQVGIGENINPSNHTDSYEDGWSEGAEWCIDYIQEKIDKLKEAD